MAYDIAHIDVYSGRALLWAEWAAALLEVVGRPVAMTLHGGGLPRMFADEPLRMRRLLARAASVAAPSTFLRDAASMVHRPITIIPNGLDVHRYPFRRRSPASPRLIWLRAFHQIYRPLMAVEVMAQLVNAKRDVHLTMVGPDKDGSMTEVRQRARGLGIEDRIHITGGIPKEQVSEVLAGADIFLNTSDVDNTPVSLIEAAAAGLCIVSTNVGGIPHLLEHRSQALLVSPNDPDAMALAIGEVLDNSALAATISQGARSMAESLDWQPITSQWEARFLQIASERLTSRSGQSCQT